MSFQFPTIPNYKIIGKIGAGGYSTVYKAQKQDDVKDIYAVKTIDRQYHKKISNDNIIKEITIMKNLKHRNILELKDICWTSKYIFLVTEYCEGGDLSKLIRSKLKLKETVVQNIIQQLARALLYFRENNLTHMDLKPGNLLLTWQPELILKVGDFGLAQYMSDQKEVARFSGSPLYMAPEKLLREQFDSRVDLWATGIIMYECLFGRQPYQIINDQVLQQMSNKIPIKLPKHTSITLDCDDLLRRLLKHCPNERITFEEFFNHPFVDVVSTSGEKWKFITSLIETAAKLVINEAQYNKAIPLVEEAVKLLKEVEQGEVDTKKKATMQFKIIEYESWINSLKKSLDQATSKVGTSKSKDTTKEDFDTLLILSCSTPNLASALEIGHLGDLYVAEEKLDLALEKFKSALTILMPILRKEPKGIRRQMLHNQILRWMYEAEKTRANLPTSANAK